MIEAKKMNGLRLKEELFELANDDVSLTVYLSIPPVELLGFIDGQWYTIDLKEVAELFIDKHFPEEPTCDNCGQVVVTKMGHFGEGTWYCKSCDIYTPFEEVTKDD